MIRTFSSAALALAFAGTAFAGTAFTATLKQSDARPQKRPRQHLQKGRQRDR